MKRNCLAILLAILATVMAWSSDSRTFVLDMLRTYSPEGYYIVDTYMNESDNPTDFMEYFDNTSQDSIMGSFDTIVHEMSHGYMSTCPAYSTKFFIAGEESILVHHTDVYRTSEMVDEFPNELRTFRFSYIDTNSPNLGSQVDGVYGLLNEMNAYYLGCNMSYNLYRYYLEQGPDANWLQYFGNINCTLYGIVEFKLYVLKYIMYAKKEYPDIYLSIVQNGAFREAFKNIDANASKFITEYFETKTSIFSDLQASGYTIEEDDSYLYIGKGDSLEGNGHFLDTYNLLAGELAKPEYMALIRYLSEGEKGPEYPFADIKGVSGMYDNSEDSYKEETYFASFGEGISELTPIDERIDIPEESDPELSENRSNSQTAVPAIVPSLDQIPETNFFPINPGEETLFTDQKGDVDMPFIDITSAGVRRYENAIEFSISFDSLPEKLLFNDPRVEPDYLEYSWSIEVDLQGDGKYDYSISADSFKFGDASPIESTILKYTQKNVWEITTDGASWVDIPLIVDKSGNTLVFLLQENSTLPLSAFTQGSCYRFSSYVNKGVSTYYDSLQQDRD